MPDYPPRLLPKVNYRTRIDFTPIDKKLVYLQRKCYEPIEKCCVGGDRNIVTPAAFGNSGLYKMSVNLIGAQFEIGDEIWYQKVSEEDEWNGGDVNIAVYEGKYYPEDIKNSVYFTFEIANTLKWDFPRAFPTEEERNKYRDAIVGGMSDAKFSDKTVYRLNAHSMCAHSPNNLNYWHVEVRTIIDSVPEEEVDDNNKNYKKKAVRGLVEKLRVHSTLIPPSDFAKIPESVYLLS